MTAYRFLRRSPMHIGHDRFRVHGTPSHVRDFGTNSAGRPFHEAVRAAIPRTLEPHF